MVSLDDLNDISDHKRSTIIHHLDDLLTFRESDGRLSPVITGYNFYTTVLPESNRAVVLSHLHETHTYQQAMIEDLEKLGYREDAILTRIRHKGARFLWDPQFIHRDENGDLLPVAVRDKRVGRQINLSSYTLPLSFYPEFGDSKGHLLADEKGWELNMPFRSELELKTLVSLFLGKSRRESDDAWPGAYKIPVLLLGQSALRFVHEFPDFEKALKISLYEGCNELSFVIHDKLRILRSLPQYGELEKLGFIEEPCLANKSFLWSVDTFI